MKAQELRIGNLVMFRNEDYKIILISEDLIKVDIGYGAVQRFEKHPIFSPTLNELSPIPLIEEWLRKFHSDEEIEKNARFPNEITIYDRFKFIYKEEYKYWYVVTEYHKEYLTKIEFVHEYQNFIYTLTGEELTIKS